MCSCPFRPFWFNRTALALASVSELSTDGPLLPQECAHRRVFAQADRALAGRIRFVAALSPTA